MTREEQLDWLYRLRSEIYVYMPKEWLIPMNNALDMTIKALEQEPVIRHNEVKDELNRVKDELESTVKNDLGVDCVSRQAVRKILVEAKELGSWDDSSQINRLDAIDNVDMLPSVTPQEPKSEWQKDHEILKAYSDGANEVLDKIRAEIADLEEGIFSYHNDRPWVFKDEVLQIIDKYKTESEE